MVVRSMFDPFVECEIMQLSPNSRNNIRHFGQKLVPCSPKKDSFYLGGRRESRIVPRILQGLVSRVFLAVLILAGPSRGYNHSARRILVSVLRLLEISRRG